MEKIIIKNATIDLNSFKQHKDDKVHLRVKQAQCQVCKLYKDTDKDGISLKNGVIVCLDCYNKNYWKEYL